MAAPGPGHGGPSAAKDQDERYLAVLCRMARLENEDIHKKRVQLRKEIRQALENAYDIEARYWHGYHKRLGDIITVHQTGSTRRWARAFGDAERKIIEAMKTQQARYHEVAMVKQQELAAVNREFWGTWSKHLDVMRGLSPLPPSSGSIPAAVLPDVAQQSGDDQTVSASSASNSSGNHNQGDSNTSSTNGQKQSVSSKSTAKGKPLPKLMPKPLPKLLPKLSTTAMEAVNAQDQSLTRTKQGLTGGAMQPAKGATPLAAPSPLSLGSSPDPSIPASASVGKPRRRLRNSAAASSPGEPSAPTPQSLTPMSALTALGSSHEAPEEPADSAQPAKRHKAAAAEPQPKASFTPINTADPSPLASLKHTAPLSQDDGFTGVTDLVVGEIYQAYYEDPNQKGWWMCTPLPWDAWERHIGINYSFGKASLWDHWPEEQYKVDRVRARPGRRTTKKVITGWKDDFQLGGSKVRQRMFPVFLFDDVEGAPGNLKFPDSPEKPYTFPKKALKALPAEWISAANLRLPGVDVGSPVGGRDTAGRFMDRLRARKELREKKMLATPKKYKAGGSSRSAVASSPLETSSAVEASSLVEESSREDSSREDTEMADAESLSGATAVDGDTAGQLNVLEAANTLTVMKTPPTTKNSPAAEAAQSSSAKKWRDIVLGDGS